MLNRFVAKWLRQQAQEAVLQGLKPSAAAETVGERADETSTAVDIVLFFPTSRQAAGFTDLLRGVKISECHGFVERVGNIANRRVAIVETQLPHDRLALIVRDVIQLRQPSWVVSAGFAIALQSEVARGHLVIANRLIDSQGYSLGIDAKMSPAKGLHVGALLTVVEDPTDGESETTQGQAHDSALALDAQAAVIGEVCRVLKTRMLAIHGISATTADTQSKLKQGITTQSSIAGMLGAAAGALLEKPSSLKDLWNDNEKTLVVSDRLAKFLVSVMSQLPSN